MEPVMKNSKSKNKTKLGSLKNIKRVMNKYNFSYYDYIHILSYRQFPSEMLSEDNIREEVRTNYNPDVDKKDNKVVDCVCDNVVDCSIEENISDIENKSNTMLLDVDLVNGKIIGESKESGEEVIVDSTCDSPSKLFKKKDNECKELYLDELCYYSNMFATEQEFSSGMSMYRFASSTVNILMALSISVAFLIFSAFMSGIAECYKAFLSFGTLIFASYLYYKLVEHKGYLVLSRLLYPSNLRFKICKMITANLCRVFLIFSIIFSLFMMFSYLFL